MRIWFQCVGITGAILVLSSLLAFAFTRVSTWFFWSLLIGGGSFLMVFVVTTLTRLWQSMIAMLLALNLLWIFLIIGKSWESWKLGLVGALCVAGFAAIGYFRTGRVPIAAMAAVVAGTFAGAIFLREQPWFGYVVLGVAFLCNGIFIFLGRSALREIFQKRSLRHGTTAIVYSVISITVLLVAIVASQDFHYRIDLTENAINTLSDQSVGVLTNLKKPVKVTAFFDERNPQKALAQHLLDMYRYQSNKVELMLVDPDKENLAAEEHKARDGDILVEYEEQSTITKVISEEAVTQAIMKVTRTETPMVCFTEGHGELELNGPDNSSRSLSFFKSGLENEGYQSKSVAVLAGGIPADCLILVVAGPTQKLSDAAARAIDLFLKIGRKGFFLLDPRIPDPRLTPGKITVLPSGLDETLEEWGVTLGKNFILEKHLELMRGVVTGLNLQVLNYEEHEITEPLAGKKTAFQYVRSLAKAPKFAGKVSEFLSSRGGGASWTVSNVDGLFRRQEVEAGPKDLQGPVTFGVAAEKQNEDTETKLVVIGDSDFISNELIRSNEFNFDLALNVLSWLSGSAEKITIRPKMLRSSTVDLTPEQTNWVFYVTVITIPMLVLIFGINLWWIRSRRG